MDNKLKSKLVQGYWNGVLFSLFYGIFDYNFQCQQQLSKNNVRLLYLKSIGYKMLLFPPMLGLFTFTCDYLEKQGYNKNTQILIALSVGALYLQIVKFK